MKLKSIFIIIFVSISFAYAEEQQNNNYDESDASLEAVKILPEMAVRAEREIASVDDAEGNEQDVQQQSYKEFVDGKDYEGNESWLKKQQLLLETDSQSK